MIGQGDRLMKILNRKTAKLAEALPFPEAPKVEMLEVGFLDRRR